MDRFGPRPVVLVGGILAGLSWILNSYASSLGMLYFSAVIGGIGAGAYTGPASATPSSGSRTSAVLPPADRRGFGAGAALTVIPIANMVKSGGYEQAFFTSD